MKRIVICIIACLLAMPLAAQSLSPEQKKLRINIYEILKRKGFNPESFDMDGDIPFSYKERRLYYSVGKKTEAPFCVSLVMYAKYSSNESMTTFKGIQSMIAQKYKGVKLYLEENGYQLRYDIVCKDTTIVSSTMSTSINEINDAFVYIRELKNSKLLGKDFNDYDGLLTTAINLYKTDDEVDNAMAMNLFTYLADQNYSGAYPYLGNCYQNGYGVDPDPTKMEYFYNKAIENGNLWSSYKLGCVQFDRGDYTKSYNNLLRCIESESLDKSDIYYRLGYMQEKGLGMPPDRDEAIRMYRKSITFSTMIDCQAREALTRMNVVAEPLSTFKSASKDMLIGLSPAQMYERGMAFERGVGHNLVSLPKAYAYFKAAADAKYPEAYSKMGEILISQYYPFNDKETSDKYYKKALKLLKAKESSSATACYEIGRMYEGGNGLEQNDEQARYYYKIASDKGNANASWRYGIYMKNDNDRVSAFKYFLKAAEGGQGMAMYEVAKMYQYGLGTDENRSEAIKWYRKCANSNYRAAIDARIALKNMRADKEW